VLTHGLALKPGKPAITGYDDSSRCLLVGLPGHPVSAMMVFELLLGWVTDTLTAPRPSRTVEAVTDRNIPGAAGKDTLQMVRLTETEGRYTASPLFLKSGLVRRTSEADGYVVIGRNREGLRAGETVRVFLF
jgi:molybdopterin molybdotransferase